MSAGRVLVVEDDVDAADVLRAYLGCKLSRAVMLSGDRIPDGALRLHGDSCHLLDQLSGLTGLSTKKMFGEYCVYRFGKPIGFVCDDQLHLKTSINTFKTGI